MHIFVMVIYIIPAAPKVSNAEQLPESGRAARFRQPDRSCFSSGVHRISPGRVIPDFLVPAVPSLMPSPVPFSSPGWSVRKIMVSEEKRPIIRPVIRRIIGGLIDRIWRRHVGITRVVVRSGSSYRNAERRHNHRKTDGRSKPGIRPVGGDCQQKSEGQDCDQ